MRQRRWHANSLIPSLFCERLSPLSVLVAVASSLLCGAALLLMRRGLAVANGDERLQLQEALLTYPFDVHQLFDFFFHHSQRNIHAGARKVRPPPAPTIKPGRRIAIAGRSVCPGRPRRLRWAIVTSAGTGALPLVRIRLLAGSNRGRATSGTCSCGVRRPKAAAGPWAAKVARIRRHAIPPHTPTPRAAIHCPSCFSNMSC